MGISYISYVEFLIHLQFKSFLASRLCCTILSDLFM